MDAETLRTRLEALGTDESEDEDTRAWALRVLDGTEPLRREPPKPRPTADGGAGGHSPPLERSPAERFNETIRAAAGHARGIPPEQDITPSLEGGRG